jgi:acylphosphatase
VREIAAGFEVTGHVKNLPDGRVEMVAEGDASELKGFLAGIEASHLAPFIRQKAVTWAEPTGEFRTFGIAY